MMKLEKVEDPGEALVTPPPIKKPKMADRVSSHLDATPAPVVGPQTVKCYNLATCCFGFNAEMTNRITNCSNTMLIKKAFSLNLQDETNLYDLFHPRLKQCLQRRRWMAPGGTQSFPQLFPTTNWGSLWRSSKDMIWWAWACLLMPDAVKGVFTMVPMDTLLLEGTMQHLAP